MENNPHLQRTMTKTQMLLWKTTKTAKRIPDNMSEHFLFYSELTPTDPWCNMLQTLLGRKTYEEGQPCWTCQMNNRSRYLTDVCWRHSATGIMNYFHFIAVHIILQGRTSASCMHLDCMCLKTSDYLAFRNTF